MAASSAPDEDTEDERRAAKPLAEPRGEARSGPSRLAARQAREKAIGQDYAVVLAYDGTSFAGFARQPGQRTVEACLRAKLSPVVPGLRRWAVAGRTDRGVSATGQVLSFRADEGALAERIAQAVDTAAPGDLVCLGAEEAARGFHAQFWAIERRYLYLHPASPQELALAPRLDRLLAHLEGRRCFVAFSRETPPGKVTVRHLRRASCTTGVVGGQAALRFELCADGFLRRMVRVVVATALEAAKAALPDETLARIAASGDRARTATPAPPEPLRLAEVRYARWAPRSRPS